MQMPSVIFKIFDMFTLVFSVSPTKRRSCRSRWVFLQAYLGCLVFLLMSKHTLAGLTVCESEMVTAYLKSATSKKRLSVIVWIQKRPDLRLLIMTVSLVPVGHPKWQKRKQF